MNADSDDDELDYAEAGIYDDNEECAQEIEEVKQLESKVPLLSKKTMEPIQQPTLAVKPVSAKVRSTDQSSKVDSGNELACD